MTGKPQRTYYRATQRERSAHAMRVLHDHIAETHPDLCPMHGPGQGGQPPAGRGRCLRRQGSPPVRVMTLSLARRGRGTPRPRKPAKVPCPKCGKKNKPSAQFCGSCGSKMSAEKAAVPDDTARIQAAIDAAPAGSPVRPAGAAERR